MSYELTVLGRSFIDILSRFAAALLLAFPADEAGTPGGSVIRLHCTPCLAQLVHGLSSSHCHNISVVLLVVCKQIWINQPDAAFSYAPSRDVPYTAGNPTDSSYGLGAALKFTGQ